MTHTLFHSGRSIANDTAVQTLFMNITAMHSRLLRYIQQQDDKRVYLESLQVMFPLDLISSLWCMVV